MCFNNNQLKSETVDMIIHFCVAQKKNEPDIIDFIFSPWRFLFFVKYMCSRFLKLAHFTLFLHEVRCKIS